jgi:hypothetical protein
MPGRRLGSLASRGNTGTGELRSTRPSHPSRGDCAALTHVRDQGVSAGCDVPTRWSRSSQCGNDVVGQRRVRVDVSRDPPATLALGVESSVISSIGCHPIGVSSRVDRPGMRPAVGEFGGPSVGDGIQQCLSG